MTENHNYNLPEEGASEWHIPLNENFANIDRDVEIRDLDGSKLNYTPQSGAKFFATDTGDIYIGDGDSWNQVGNVATDTGAYSTVSAEQFRHEPRTTIENENVVNRGLVSTEEIEIHVSTDGDDTNPGTAERPLASLQEAFHRLPFIIQHQLRIYIHPGTYDEGSELMTGMHFVNFMKEPGDNEIFIVEGTGSSPSDVNITGDLWFNIGIRGSVPYRTVFRNFEIDGKIQNYGGCFGLRDIVFNVGSSHNAGQKSGLDGYAGYTQVVDCTFNTSDKAVYANMGHSIGIAYSDATNAGGRYKAKWDGSVWWHGSNDPS